jgi:hypothetical protein
MTGCRESISCPVDAATKLRFTGRPISFLETNGHGLAFDQLLHGFFGVHFHLDEGNLAAVSMTIFSIVADCEIPDSREDPGGRVPSPLEGSSLVSFIFAATLFCPQKCLILCFGLRFRIFRRSLPAHDRGSPGQPGSEAAQDD